MLNAAWRSVVSISAVIVVDEHMVENESLANKNIKSYELEKPIKHVTLCPFSFRVPCLRDLSGS